MCPTAVIVGRTSDRSHTHTHTHTHTHIHTHTHTHTHSHTHTHLTYTDIHTHARTHQIYIYIYLICFCLHVCCLFTCVFSQAAASHGNGAGHDMIQADNHGLDNEGTADPAAGNKENRTRAGFLQRHTHTHTHRHRHRHRHTHTQTH